MPKPWEKYAAQGQKPWEKYGQPKPAPTPSEPEGPGLLESGLSAVGDVVSGAAKEAPLVLGRAANIPRDIVSGAISLALDKFGSPALQAADIKRAEDEYRLRQMAAPLEQQEGEGKASKLGRIVSRSAPTMALAALTGGTSLPAQAAIMGGTSGAQAVSEGGGAGDIALQAALGAAAPMAGPVLSKVLGKPAQGLKALAVKQYERGLGATKESMKTEAARIAPELVERGVSGSLKGLSRRATTQVEELGRQISASYRAATQSGTKVSGSQLANALERLKVPFKETGQAGQEVVLNPRAVGAIDDMQSILRELGDASPSAIWKFRKTVDDIVSASNGFTRELPGGTAKSLQKQVRGILQEELNRAVPNVSRLNTEFRLWKGLQDVTAATMKRQTSQERNLIPAILGSGVGGGVAATGSLTGAGGAGLATAALVQFIRSPLWRTFSAVQKNALADILAGGSQAFKSEAGRNAATMLALFGAKGSVQPEPTLAGTAQ